MVQEYHFLGCDTIQYDRNQHLGGLCMLGDGGSNFSWKKGEFQSDYDVTTRKTVLLVTNVRPSNLTIIMVVKLTIMWIILYTLSAIFAVEQRLTGYCPSGTMLISTVEIICFPDQHVTGFQIAGGKSFMLPTLSLNAWYTSCWYSSL